jgi:ubiquinone/menaquinone biosynthesis C-methylase UbiE
MSLLATALGRQLSQPRGMGGRVVAQAMRFANRRPTSLSIEALGVQPGDAVVDLGCGAGDAIPALIEAAFGGIVHGLDHAPDMVALASRRHPGATFHLGSFTALPFADGSIDRVLAANVAYFWYHESAVMAEIWRVLRLGGRLAIYVTEPATLRRAGLDMTGTHQLYSADRLVELLGPAATIRRVDVGFGVRGFIATIDR